MWPATLNELVPGCAAQRASSPDGTGAGAGPRSIPFRDAGTRACPCGTGRRIAHQDAAGCPGGPGWPSVSLRESPRRSHRRRCVPTACGCPRRSVRGVVPSLRGELEYHHVDLAAGYQAADWPGDFVATELSRVTNMMDRRADAPPMTLTGLAMLHIGTRPPVDVTGPPAAMLAWLAGRSGGSDLDLHGAFLPAIPPLA
jgi:hypothetical protein